MGFLPILLPFLEAVTGKRINPGGPKRPFQKTDEFGGQRPRKKRINVRQSRIFQDGLHAYIPGSYPGRAAFGVRATKECDGRRTGRDDSEVKAHGVKDVVNSKLLSFSKSCT